MVCEFIKSKRSLVLLMAIVIPLCINAMITFDLHFRYYGYLIPNQAVSGLSNWQLVFKEQTILYFSEWLTLFSGLIIFEIFNMESKNDAWNIILTMPTKKENIILQKFLTILSYTTILLVVNIVTMLAAGLITGVEMPIEYSLFFKVFIVHWFAMLAVISIQITIALVLKKTIMLLPISIVLSIISANMYYEVEGDISKYNPFCFASYSYIADKQMVIYIVIVSVILCLLGLIISSIIFNKKESFE